MADPLRSLARAVGIAWPRGTGPPNGAAPVPEPAAIVRPVAAEAPRAAEPAAAIVRPAAAEAPRAAEPAAAIVRPVAAEAPRVAGLPPRKKRLRYVQMLKLTVQLFERGMFQLWDHNREINDRRAHAIADYVAANDYDIGPQPLIIGALPDGRHYLLDGQHRLRAGQFLGEAADHVEIGITIEYCQDEAELRKLFRVVNLGTPVPVRYYDEEMNTFIVNTAPRIKRRWAAAYSKATSSSRPWFTSASLQVQLGNGRCREAVMLGILTPEMFLRELENLCRDVEEDYRVNPEGAARRYSTHNTQTVYARALEKGFCAGVIHNWGELVAIRLIEGRVR